MVTCRGHVCLLRNSSQSDSVFAEATLLRANKSQPYASLTSSQLGPTPLPVLGQLPSRNRQGTFHAGPITLRQFIREQLEETESVSRCRQATKQPSGKFSGSN